mgnify:CR=1 FL=1|jgi:hypothetical protein|tara:strand:- start:11 stop:601 length:591 start_codon:yes stop_codon:yes gene_type:complete
MEKKVNIDNFIGIYDGYIMKDQCDNAIAMYENEDKFKRTMNRIEFERSSITEKQDQQFFATGDNHEVWWTTLKPLIINFEMAFKHYIKNTGADKAYDDFHFTNLKLQKTLQTEGYHTWHIEHASILDNAYRSFVYSIYLNDVEEGGETEFLHFSKRVKPKIGRIVIWPAAFPYLHRGNPPLSGDGKYILTSWIMMK